MVQAKGACRTCVVNLRATFVFLSASFAILIAPSDLAGAAGQLTTPSYAGSWNLPTNAPDESARQIAVAPSGDVYVLTSRPPGISRILHFTHDGTLVDEAATQTGARGIATDGAGHVLVAGAGKLLKLTSGLGVLAEYDLARETQGRIAYEAGGHLLVTESGDGAEPVITRYALGGGAPVAVASASFPGAADLGYTPPGFFDVAAGSDGSIYANGVSTTSRFIVRYTPGLGGPPAPVDECSDANFYACFPGYGLAIAKTHFSNGDEDALYVAGGRTDTSVNTTGTQVHSLTRPLGGRATFGPQSDGVPETANDVAASPCRASVYVLDNLFGGPGGTFSGNQVEQYTTHVPATVCTGIPEGSVGAFSKPKYTLRPLASATRPCVPCAGFAASGDFVGPAAGRHTLASLKRRAPRGTDVVFEATAAGDLTFAFRGPLGGNGQPRARGGFVYDAVQGSNTLKLTGVIKPRKPLAPGVYRVAVSSAAGQPQGGFRLKVAESR